MILKPFKTPYFLSVISMGHILVDALRANPRRREYPRSPRQPEEVLQFNQTSLWRVL